MKKHIIEALEMSIKDYMQVIKLCYTEDSAEDFKYYLWTRNMCRGLCNYTDRIFIDGLISKSTNVYLTKLYIDDAFEKNSCYIFQVPDYLTSLYEIKITLVLRVNYLIKLKEKIEKDLNFD